VVGRQHGHGRTPLGGSRIDPDPAGRSRRPRCAVSQRRPRPGLAGRGTTPHASSTTNLPTEQPGSTARVRRRWTRPASLGPARVPGHPCARKGVTVCNHARRALAILCAEPRRFVRPGSTPRESREHGGPCIRSVAKGCIASAALPRPRARAVPWPARAVTAVNDAHWHVPSLWSGAVIGRRPCRDCRERRTLAIPSLKSSAVIGRRDCRERRGQGREPIHREPTEREA
jgi:hypothetical protein